MSKPLTIIPNLLEHCFHFDRSCTDLENSVLKAELKLLANVLRTPDYTADHLRMAKKFLDIPDRWTKEESEIVFNEYDAAVESLS